MSFSNETREHIPGGKDLKYGYINSPYRNFFKHADQDTEAVSLPLNNSDVDILIFLAVENYLRLLKNSRLSFKSFSFGSCPSIIDKLSAEALSEILGAIESAFPNIGSLMRAYRLDLGKKALADARVDQELLNDPRTEHAT